MEGVGGYGAVAHIMMARKERERQRGREMEKVGGRWRGIQREIEREGDREGDRGGWCALYEHAPNDTISFHLGPLRKLPVAPETGD